MSAPRPKRLGWWLAVPALALLAVAGLRALDQRLTRDAGHFSLEAFLRSAGLPGRVATTSWQRTRFVLWPRPALVLDHVSADLLSGKPGPGAASGSIRLNAIRLVPGPSYLRTGRFDRIEAGGGSLSISSDLLPQLSAYYVDPIDASHRPIPWSSLLAIAGDSLTGAGASPPAIPLDSPAPLVVVRGLRILLTAPEVLPRTDLVLEQARLTLSGPRLAVQGEMRVRSEGSPALSFPVRIVRTAGPAGERPSWDAAIGRPGAGFRVEVRSAREGAESWRVFLDDPRGRLAGALLAGRSGVFERLDLSGSWRMQSFGTGSFPGGMKETRIELVRGRLSEKMPGGERALIVRGRLRVVPGRVELPSLTLQNPNAATDTATLRFDWSRTLHGKRVRGEVTGRLDPAWLALAGPEWTAAGSVSGRIGFEGAFEAGEGAWTLLPGSRVEGTVGTLAGPWFADTLRSARVEAWTEQGTVHLVLFGRWGSSPFRLEARGLPQPAARYLDLAASQARWSFRSRSCRLEDFGLASARSFHGAPIPFWMGLPGRGTIEIGHGTIGGIPFDTLRSEVFRGPQEQRLDTLVARIAGGTVAAGRQLLVPGSALDRTEKSPELQVSLTDVDLSALGRSLQQKGILPGCDLVGRLSGSLRFGWMPEEPDRVRLEGALRTGEGSARGLPFQDLLAEREGLGSFSTLAFDRCRMDFCLTPGEFSWSRLQLDAPRFRLEGAGRVFSGRTWDAAVLVHPHRGSGSGGAGEASPSAPDGAGTLYVLVGGPIGLPGLRLVSRSQFLEQLARMGGELPSGEMP